MNSTQKAIARLMFQNKLLKASGQQFEDIFTTVMGYARPDFRPIKPQGSLGDRKNDGCEPLAGRYYQVYAPENINQNKTKAIKKLEQDFSGLMNYWAKLHPSGIREFYFVVNDRYSGPLTTLQSTIFRLQKQYHLRNADILINKDLEQILFGELAEDEIISIIGFLPEPTTITELKADATADVIRNILRNSFGDESHRSQKVCGVSKDPLPAFKQKLEYNNLNIAAPFLKGGLTKIDAVATYFESVPFYITQKVTLKFEELFYSNMRKPLESDPVGGLTKGDKVYFGMLSDAHACYNGELHSEELQNVLIVLFTYFFLTADIFGWHP
jgi:hypothetical protein